MHIFLHQGQGIVARTGQGLLAAPGTPSREALAPILATFEEVCGPGGTPGRALARKLVGYLVDTDPSAVPDFGIVTRAEVGWAVILHGAVDLVALSPGGMERFSGADAATWVDRILPEDISLFALGTPGIEPVRFRGPFDLRDGVVPGGGMSIAVGAAVTQKPLPADVKADETMAASPVTPPTTAVPPPPAAAPPPIGQLPFISIPLDGAADLERRAPLPIIGEEAPEQAEQEGPIVDGILCERDHFNHPLALFCSSCGVSTVHRTRTAVKGPRPTLGVLVGDDGSTFALDDPYLVGREPENDKKVIASELRPLKLFDAERSVSRAHAEVRLQDWDVVIVDRHSANGTYVAPRGESEWRRLAAEHGEIIQPGTRIAFGKRVMTFDTHHQA